MLIPENAGAEKIEGRLGELESVTAKTPLKGSE